MPLTVEPPSADEEASGIAARFEYRDDEHAVTMRGVAKRGNRGLTIARLEIAPDNEDVTAGLARHLQLGTLLAELRAAVPVPSAAVSATTKAPAFPRNGGRAPLTDDHLRAVASAYLAETAPGAPPGAMKRMAERFERPEETIRTWVARARRDGWLGPSVRGRAGAEPGPRLLEKNIRVEKRKNGVTDDVLRRVAIAYLAETAAGKPTGALKRLAEQFDRPEKTVQGWIARARAEGWLGPGHKGRMGADPGPRLLTEIERCAA